MLSNSATVKTRGRDIDNSNYRIALTSDRHNDSTTTDVSVKWQSECTILNANIAASICYNMILKCLFCATTILVNHAVGVYAT